MKPKQNNVAGLIVLGVLLYLMFGNNLKCDSLPIPTPGPEPSQVTRVTYVYEKNEGGVPPGVSFALREINEAGEVIAAAIEQDITDASGSTPPQHSNAVTVAKRVGLPVLIVEGSGGTVLGFAKVTNEEQVREAVQLLNLETVQ